MTEPKRSTSPAIPCASCGASWTGVSRAHCGGCHRTFSSVWGFDLHRDARGDRGSCSDPAGISAVEFRDGMWRGLGFSDEQKAELFGVSA